jgi:hypothetical protein
MSHFRLNKKAKHFRTLRGWNNEIKEVSISFLAVVLLVTAFSANTARAAQSFSGLPFLGIVTAVTPCGTPPAGPAPCKTLIAPNIYVSMIGLPLVEGDLLITGVIEGSIPRPGSFVGGYAVGPVITDFYGF